MGSAFLGHGRFGKITYVGLPNADERSLILKALARGKPIAANVDLDAIAHSDDCSNFSGADLDALMKKAIMTAMKERQMASADGYTDRSPIVIQKSHLEAALDVIVPSIDDEDRDYYEKVARKYIKQRKQTRLGLKEIQSRKRALMISFLELELEEEVLLLLLLQPQLLPLLSRFGVWGLNCVASNGLRLWLSAIYFISGL